MIKMGFDKFKQMLFSVPDEGKVFHVRAKVVRFRQRREDSGSKRDTWIFEDADLLDITRESSGLV